MFFIFFVSSIFSKFTLIKLVLLGKQKNILISGNNGVLIYYIVNGQGRVRRMPKKVRRTKATKKSAGHFSKAVRLSAAIRGGLGSLLPESKGRDMINRVNIACNQWMHDPGAELSIPKGEIPYLYQLQFNEKIELTARFKLPLVVDWTIPGMATLQLPQLNPKQHISAPFGTVTIHMRVGITGCTVKEWEGTDGCFVLLDIPYSNEFLPEQSLQLPCASGPGHIWLMAVAITYTVARKGRTRLLRQQQWMPAGVIGTKIQQ